MEIAGLLSPEDRLVQALEKKESHEFQSWEQRHVNNAFDTALDHLL